MPLLEYNCEQCKYTFEELVKDSNEQVECPKCHAVCSRKWSGTVYTSTGKKTKKCSGKCSTCSGC